MSNSCRQSDGRCAVCGGDWSVCGCQRMLDRSTAAAPPVDAVPGEPVASWIADDLADKLKGFNALLKAGKDTIPVMTVYTQLNSLRNRVQATLAASVASRAGSEPEKVYLIATGETHSGYETYTRHENSVPFADHEVLYTAPIAPAAAAEPSELAEMEARKDAAYLERNQVVAALAKCFPSGVARTAIEGWSEDWHGCVYIDLPTGQASWHFHDSQAYLFDDLPPYTGAWDGHDTPEKYSRLAALASPPTQDSKAPNV